MLIHDRFRLAEDRDIQNCAFHFQLKTFLFNKNFDSKNIVDIFQRFRNEDFVIKNHEKEMIEKTKKKIIFSLDDECFSVR